VLKVEILKYLNFKCEAEKEIGVLELMQATLRLL